MRVPLVLSRANAFMARNPWLSGVAITCAKNVSADWIVQKFIENRETYDGRRGLVFLCFGFFYQGSCQYFMFNHIMEHFWPTRIQTLRQAFYKTALANLVCDPFFFFPTFYYMREALNTDDWSHASFIAGLMKYKVNCVNDWINAWRMWIPGFGVAFFVMPPHMRLPWISFVSFSYVIVLSVTRGDWQVDVDKKPMKTTETLDLRFNPPQEPMIFSSQPHPQGISGLDTQATIG